MLVSSRLWLAAGTQSSNLEGLAFEPVAFVMTLATGLPFLVSYRSRERIADALDVRDPD